MLMDKRHTLKQREFLPAATALSCAFTFFVAINYCNVEALSAHPTPSEGFGHHHSTEDHHDGAVPTPSDEDALCCATLHAVPTSKVDVTQRSLIQRINPITVEVFGRDFPIPPARSASGWSPPERGPTPLTPFYRTTYANHAPPAFLA